jgi:uncharacterized protein (TIGR02594 family)
MTLSTSVFSLRGLTASALCSVAVVALVSPASARPRHHHHGYHHHHHARHYASQAAGWDAFAEAASNPRVRNARASMGSTSAGFGSSNVVEAARQYIGGNPTGRSRLWCARFMNMVLQSSGYRGTGSDMASSFAGYGQRISGPQVGAIAVMSRRGGGHVGVVSGIDANGNPIVISGNHGHRVAESVYSRGRIYAYVMPTS